MVRPRKDRTVRYIPEVTYFKPAGIPLRYLDELIVTIEEMEAIRLKDLEGLEQQKSAELMHISRPTFHRLITSAHKKIAEALVQGKAIRVEGGTFRMNGNIQRSFKCKACGHEWQVPYGTGQKGIDMECPRCQSRDIHRNEQDGRGYGRRPWGRKE